ncbi:sugar transferase [Sporolactobacillus sp. THM7-4]|nr:sugar transferase [Sporolactobacillus sp. THM7-4]
MDLSKPVAEKKIPSSINVTGNVKSLQSGCWHEKFYLMVKRIMDICGALLGLILFSPLFIIIPILIKWDDPEGSVFFSQLRVGKNGRLFHIYKFRSMVRHAEKMLDSLLDQNETTGAMFKMKNDPRVTRVGHFLRKTSLDEIPQFVNVLKGEMSLVGPRPPLPREVKRYTEYHRQRLLVKPGCTGLWQIKGRSNVGFETMVRLDLLYIRRRGIGLDIKILLKTLLIPFRSKNAY